MPDAMAQMEILDIVDLNIDYSEISIESAKSAVKALNETSPGFNDDEP